MILFQYVNNTIVETNKVSSTKVNNDQRKKSQWNS